MFSRFFNADDLASLPVLLREVGLLDALRLGARVKAAVSRGEPYLGWPEPADAKERDSRAQIGAAILLYRDLTRLRGADEALRITREVVIEAACAQLRRQIGPLRREMLAQLSEDERTRFAQERGDKFVNADMVWGDISARPSPSRSPAAASPPSAPRQASPNSPPSSAPATPNSSAPSNPKWNSSAAQRLRKGRESAGLS